MTRIHVMGRERVEKGPKISDPTKRRDTQLNLFDINGILALKCCCADLSEESFGPLNKLISKGCSETGILGHRSNFLFRNE